MTQGIVVLGAGGHARVCIELLRAAGETVDWCVGSHDSPSHCLGVPVLKGDDALGALAAKGYQRAFVAIGANTLRQRLANAVLDNGMQLVSAISPAAHISPTAIVGSGVAIMAGVVINASAAIGAHAIINSNAGVDHDCVVGTAAHVSANCQLAGTVHVGDRAFLGVGSTVIPGVRIGNDVMVGAGAVVIRDVEAGATVVGVPARVVKKGG